MIDFFTIFTKGGIVLLYIENANEKIAQSVNSLVKSLILQELGAGGAFMHNSLALKYKLDNEFELIFVVGYQKMLQLSYVDKFLDAIHLEFRDKYREELVSSLSNLLSRNFDVFADNYANVLRDTQAACKLEASRPAKMRTFNESQKSKKTVASMRVTPSTGATPVKPLANGAKKPTAIPEKDETVESGDPKTTAAMIELNKSRMEKKFGKKGGGDKKKKPASSPAPPKPVLKGKQNRRWDNGVTKEEAAMLDYSNSQDVAGTVPASDGFNNEEIETLRDQLSAELGDVEVPSDDSEEDDTEVQQRDAPPTSKRRFGFGLLSSFLPGAKTLTKEEMKPALEKMKDHLIAKNVAADVSEELIDSVATKLEGKHLGTFERVVSAVRNALEEACSQILAPKRRVDILRDVLEAKARGLPYVVVFCGVNGVGKSTNLAKICFWLTGQGHRVMIAACDTFRSGAVEQLKTHVRRLNSIHGTAAQQMVQLYEKGYGKDAAGIAMEAINFARDTKLEVVLVDTAGRMQDNEPLMRSLAKLIRVNDPNLVLFVGEALVGNDGVDQLVSFNRSLANFSNSTDPHLIDGIVLTKFDTVDDQVGAAISMTYSSGQPIVFVGTGQTYTDLKRLSVPAVVKSLMK